MDGIVEFLQARYDEREGRAKAAGGAAWSVGVEETPDGENAFYSVSVDGAPEWFVDVDVNEHAKVEHIADNDPEFVLADVAAKRQIMEEHRDDEGWCLRCADPPQYDAAWHKYPCRTMRLLALPFAGHPDYREEWKP